MIKLKNNKKLFWIVFIAEIALYIVMLWFGRQDVIFFYDILQSEPNLINFLIYLSMFLIPLLRIIVFSVIVGLIVLVISCLNL